MRIACVQCEPEYLEPEANRSKTDALLDDLDADLVVLPELLPSGYFFRSEADVASVVEDERGPTTAWLHDWAQQLDAVLVAGYPEKDGDALYNSAAIVGPSGLIDTYRKVHLFNEEKRWFEPGDNGFPVHTITTSSGTTYRLGVMICFDWYFPEAARTLALQGADVIAHPSNLVLPHCPNSMPIRARENHVFTITANRYGSETSGDETLDFIGQSSVCDPNGDVLYRGKDEGDEVFTTTIRPHEARNRRINKYNDIFADRRPDMYNLTSD
ncbi:acyltransferase [Longibacter salinarum]|uniref:Acyltransferase n=1 Tax=Longibacter salinarum TaxID=1850348 RepID=A0A2A8D354_9BACT|nr:acyltransferase [Longibacter salinarum]